MNEIPKARPACSGRARDIVRLGSRTIPKGVQIVVIVYDISCSYIESATNGGHVSMSAIVQMANDELERATRGEKE